MVILGGGVTVRYSPWFMMCSAPRAATEATLRSSLHPDNVFVCEEMPEDFMGVNDIQTNKPV